MAEKKTLAKFLHGFLGFMWWVGLAILVFMVVGSMVINQGGSHLIDTIIRVVMMSVGLLVIYELRRILRSILERDPFRPGNITALRKIGYAVLLIGLIDVAVSYPTFDGAIEFLATSYGAVKPAIIVYLLLGCLAFILSEVFQAALEIKRENELTV